MILLVMRKKGGSLDNVDDQEEGHSSDYLKLNNNYMYMCMYEEEEESNGSDDLCI